MRLTFVHNISSDEATTSLKREKEKVRRTMKTKRGNLKYIFSRGKGERNRKRKSLLIDFGTIFAWSFHVAVLPLRTNIKHGVSQRENTAKITKFIQKERFKAKECHTNQREGERERERVHQG
jgi:hypothetical protein